MRLNDECGAILTPDGRRLATSSRYTVRVWDAGTGAELARFEEGDGASIGEAANVAAGVGRQGRRMRTPTLFVGNNRLQMEQVGLPEAPRLDEGELAAVMLRSVGALKLLWLVLRSAAGRLGDANDVVNFSFRSIVVTPAGSVSRRGPRRQRPAGCAHPRSSRPWLRSGCQPAARPPDRRPRLGRAAR